MTTTKSVDLDAIWVLMVSMDRARLIVSHKCSNYLIRVRTEFTIAVEIFQTHFLNRKKALID